MAKATPTVLTTGTGGTGGTSYNTASISPSSNKLILVAVYNRRSGAAGTNAALTGNGLTYTQVVSDVATDGSNTRFSIFRAMGTSPTSGAITISFSGITQQECHWQVVEWAGTLGTAALACPQGKAVSNTNNTTSMSGSLDTSITKVNNATYGGMGLVDVIGSGITPGDSETELADQTSSSSGLNWRSQFQWKQGTDSNMAWGYASGGNQPIGAFVEVVSSDDAGVLLNFV